MVRVSVRWSCWERSVQSSVGFYTRLKLKNYILLYLIMPRIKIIDNTMFGDVWVNKSGVRKIKKYIMLKDEIAKMWSMKKVTVIPIVVGALVAISTGSEKYLNWV